MKNMIAQYSGLKREVYILFVGKLVTAMGSFVWPMLTFLLTAKLGFSDGTAAMLIATAGLISLPVTLLGGKLADRFARKNIILFFDCLTVGMYILAFLLPIGNHTAVLAFLASLFQNVETPAYDALNADYSTTAQRERAFSLSYLGFNLGYVFGASLGGMLFRDHTNLAFLVNALAIFTSTVLIFFFVKPENAVREQQTEAECYGEYEMPLPESVPVARVLWQRRAVLFVLLIGCLTSVGNSTVCMLLPLQLKGTMGEQGAAVYGYLNSFNGLVVILFTPILTMALKRLTEIPKTVLSMVLFISSMILFRNAGAMWRLYAGIFVYTLGEIVCVLGSNPYASRRVPASHRGRIGGIGSVLYAIFQTVNQYLISFVLMAAQGQYHLLWLIFIGIGLIGVALYILVYPLDRRSFPQLYAGETF